MTIPSDPSANPVESRELLPIHSFHHPFFDEVSDARMRRLTATYYSGRFKFQLLQELVMGMQSSGENRSDHDQHILDTRYPTLAEYLAYLSQLDAESR